MDTQEGDEDGLNIFQSKSFYTSSHSFIIFQEMRLCVSANRDYSPCKFVSPPSRPTLTCVEYGLFLCLFCTQLSNRETYCTQGLYSIIEMSISLYVLCIRNCLHLGVLCGFVCFFVLFFL